MKNKKKTDAEILDTGQPEERFQDENLTLEAFSRYFLVHCPQCQKRAEVNSKEDGHAQLTCRHCGFVKINTPVLFQMRLKANCPDCGGPVNFNLDNLTKKEDKIDLTCPACQRVQTYRPNYLEFRVLSQNFGEGKDRYFGRELWLQSNFKGNLLWANNFAHLDYLKRYVQARLRERNNRQGFTLVEKLPQFIKSAKNRGALLKEIEKLERKI